MPEYKFHIGQTVYLRPAVAKNIPGGAYQIIARLPEREGEFQYRIKGMNEAHERVVRESELTSS
jgi:hypothetical protein